MGKELTVPSTKVRQLFQGPSPILYKKGEVLVRGDEESEYVYLIEDGFVKVYTIDREGTKNTQLFYQPRDMFPMLWALDKTEEDSYYEAHTDLRVKKVTKQEFLRHISNDLDVMAFVWQHINDIFNIFYSRTSILQQKTAYDKVLAQLAFLAERSGAPLRKGYVRIIIPLTHQDIAELVNLSRETASRELEKMKRSRLIRYSDGTRYLEIHQERVYKKVGIK